MVARHADLGVGAVKRRSEGRWNGVLIAFQFALIETQSYRQGAGVAGYCVRDGS